MCYGKFGFVKLIKSMVCSIVWANCMALLYCPLCMCEDGVLASPGGSIQCCVGYVSIIIVPSAYVKMVCLFDLSLCALMCSISGHVAILHCPLCICEDGVLDCQ